MSRPRPADPPEHAERPVPPVAVPDGTSRPEDWSTSTTAPLEPPAGGDDRVLAERQRAERRAREAGGPGVAPGADPESSYTTEESQGAAQPAPTTRRTDA